MKYLYKTKGTCSRSMCIEIDENGIIKDLEIVGGCNGNLQGIISLVKGQNAKEVASKLEGIDCGGRGTSCPDQLAQAIKEAYANM